MIGVEVVLAANMVVGVVMVAVHVPACGAGGGGGGIGCTWVGVEV